MERIYVTGIAGMLGGNIAYLLKDKYEIYGVDRIPIFDTRIHAQVFDLLDYETLRESIDKIRPKYLIHTAAMINVDFCEKEPELAEELNFKLTEFLAKVCKDISCKMLYISTDAVFNGKCERLYLETDTVDPINVYGKTKLKGEYAVLDNDHIVVRTNIYGYNLQEKNSLGEWILKALQDESTIRLFTDIYFSPILVNELVEIIVQLLEREDICKEIYHVCGTGSVSKCEFGEKIAEIFGLRQCQIIKGVSEDMKFLAKRAKNMGMSNEKVKKLLKRTIRTPNESIDEFYRLYNDGFADRLKEMGICG